MMRQVLLAMFICFSALSLSDACAQSPQIVGYIKTADQDYTVERNGSPVKLSADKGVCNGDVIIPVPGKSVILDYAYCPKVSITTETEVKCAITNEKPGWFKDFFTNFMEALKLKATRTATDENGVYAPQHRYDRERNCDRGCFPRTLFRVFPLPFENATLLHSDKPMIFRWEDPVKLSPLQTGECSQVRLMITKTGEKPMPPVAMKVGELIALESSGFQAGASYQWHVEAGGKRSAAYHFRILSKDESEKIRAQMKAATGESDIGQALWLQLKSNRTPGLDFYTDTLRIMKEYKYCRADMSVFDEIVNRVFRHGVHKLD